MVRSGTSAAIVLLVIVALFGAFRVAPAEITVHPGSFADGCTLAFLFNRGADDRFMALAGHCLLDDGQEKVWTGTTGPTVTVDGIPIGHAVYAIWNQKDLNPLPDPTNPNLPLPADFALVHLDRSIKADARVCHFGGPTGIDAFTDDTPRIVHFFGNGEVIARIQETGTPVTPARTAPAIGFSDPRAVALIGPVGPGDSGMPVIDDSGRAVGILSHLGSPLGSSFAPVSRLWPHLQRAELMLGVRLKLQTAPLEPTATPFGSVC